MKKIVLTLAILLPVLLWGQINEKKVETKVSEVTIYASGARVVRTGEIAWQAGDTRLRFTALSSLIDRTSIQVKCEGNFEVISVNSSLNHLVQQTPAAEVKKLNNQLDEINSRLAELRAMRNVFDKEEAMLMANQSIGTEQNGVTLTQLQQMADFFRNRLTDLKTQRRETDQKIEKFTDQSSLIADQISSLRAPGPADPTTEIEVMIRSHAAGRGEITLSYYTDGAKWTPLYDLRVDDIRQPVKLIRKAEVMQQTGEDWNKVKITLSSADPNLSGSKPDLGIQFISNRSFVKPAARQRIVINEGEYRMSKSTNNSTGSVAPKPQKQTSVSSLAAFSDRLQRDYPIPTPYTIRCDGQAYYVAIGETPMPGQFEFQSVPAKEAATFVVARIPGWESYDLLSGIMSLFFEGTYIGQSWLDAEQTADTLELSLGRDPFILVERKLQKEFTSDQALGSSRKSQRSYEITVRNTKSEPVAVRIEDQYPVSQVDDIKVELLESAGAIIDKENGRLTWIMNLSPTQTRKVSFKYEVKYPKSVGKLIE